MAFEGMKMLATASFPVFHFRICLFHVHGFISLIVVFISCFVQGKVSRTVICVLHPRENLMKYDILHSSENNKKKGKYFISVNPSRCHVFNVPHVLRCQCFLLLQAKMTLKNDTCRSLITDFVKQHLRFTTEWCFSSDVYCTV